MYTGIALLTKQESWPAAYKVVLTLAALVIGAFYLWCVQDANEPFEWHYYKEGFYDYLGHAFAQGQLHLPIEPPPDLLALPDPWDPERNGQFGGRDLVLYNRHYYLYHGPVPACLLFAPWRLLTGGDLPEAFAGFLFCIGGFVCCCGVLMRFLSWIDVRPPLPLFTLLVLALGICQTAPFLLQRVMVYEVAIAGGYFFVSAGFLFLARGMLAPRISTFSLALSGLMLGLAVGCRPPLAFAAVSAWLMLLRCVHRARPFYSRPILAFTLPVAACALQLAAYNYARFHDPLEFGLRYMLASAGYLRAAPAPGSLLPGLYYLLASPPDFDPVFPFFRLVNRMPFNSPAYPRPERYFLEPIAGAFAIWPLSLVALASPAFLRRLPDRPAQALIAALCISAVAVVLFTAALGLVAHRFEMDFLPLFVLMGCCLVAAARGRILRAIGAGAIVYSIAASLALGIQGPYDDFVQAHPAAYVKLARWFSPVRHLRPLYNPRLTMDASYEFPALNVPGPLPLISAGRFGSRYLLSAEMLAGNRLRLTSGGPVTSGNVAAVDVSAITGAPNRVRLDYLPESREIIIQWNGGPVLRHDLRFLVTAPAQFNAGVDRTGIDPAPVRFPGRVAVASKMIDGRADE